MSNMDLQEARRQSVWTQVMEPHGLSLEMHTCPISFRWFHSSYILFVTFNWQVSQNPKTLKQAMSSYTQAEKDVVSRSSPELHYNKVYS